MIKAISIYETFWWWDISDEGTPDGTHLSWGDTWWDISLMRGHLMGHISDEGTPDGTHLSWGDTWWDISLMRGHLMGHLWWGDTWWDIYLMRGHPLQIVILCIINKTQQQHGDLIIHYLLLYNERFYSKTGIFPACILVILEYYANSKHQFYNSYFLQYKVAVITYFLWNWSG